MLTNIHASEVSVELFQSRLNAVCGAFQVEPVASRDQLTGAVMRESRAGFDIAHVATDVSTIRRTRKDIGKDAAENFFLIVQEEGHALMCQNQTASMIWPGDMILIDSAQPSAFSFFGSFGRQLSVHLPRSEMYAHFGEDVAGGLHIPKSDYTSLALTAVLAKAFAPTSNAQQSEYLHEAMFGLIGAMLHERADGGNTRQIQAEVSHAQLLKRGLAYIDQKFDDSHLTIHTVASDLGVSIRQLQRAFETAGITPTNYLLQKRLEKACQLLLARRQDSASMLVSTIAYSCGFNDVSYFNRQFRRMFGCAPGKYH